MNDNAMMGICTANYAEAVTSSYAVFLSTPAHQPSSTTLMLVALALICLILRRGRPYHTAA